jgi:hypothetical protein
MFPATTPFSMTIHPRRRDDLEIAEVGDEVVLLDCERLHYRTLNPSAAAVWRRCDGTRSIAEIASELGMPDEVVVYAVDQLQEAGVLTTPAANSMPRVTRRDAAKWLVAGLVVLPAVASITAPAAQAAQSFVCTVGGSRNGEANEFCDSDGDCISCCCHRQQNHCISMSGQSAQCMGM